MAAKPSRGRRGSAMDMTAQEICNAIYGLQGMDSKYPEVISVVQVCAATIPIYWYHILLHYSMAWVWVWVWSWGSGAQPTVRPQATEETDHEGAGAAGG